LKPITFFILSFIYSLFAQSCFIPVKHISASVAYLYDIHPQKQVIENRIFEVWLKPVTGSGFIPTKEQSSGTGFFVSDNSHSFLVTAHHVAKTMSINSLVVLQDEKDRPITIPFSKLIKTNSLQWTMCNDADIAILKLSLNSDIIKIMNGHFLQLSLIDDTLRSPILTKSLLTIGFPLNLINAERFSPILKESKPVSGLLNLQRFDTISISTFYLLDSPSIEGYSGAPVFEPPDNYLTNDLILGGRWACVGLIHGTIADKTGGKLGAVVPSYYIIETIKQAIKEK
jgi:hypothetical protein